MTERKFERMYQIAWINSRPDCLLEIQWFIKGAPPGRDGSLRTA